MKKTNLFLTVIFAMGVLAVFALSGCEESEKEYTVKYEITGPAIVAPSITYRVKFGVVDSKNNVKIPWSKTITFDGNSNPSFSASLKNNSSHNAYTAKIYVNGKEKYSTTSSEDTFITASCLIK